MNTKQGERISLSLLECERHIVVAFALIRSEPFTLFGKERLLTHFLSVCMKQVAVFRDPLKSSEGKH